MKQCNRDLIERKIEPLCSILADCFNNHYDDDSLSKMICFVSGEFADLFSMLQDDVTSKVSQLRTILKAYSMVLDDIIVNDETAKYSSLYFTIAETLKLFAGGIDD